MKANWTKSNQLTNQAEGGYVNRKDDKGGPTNMGITLARLSQERGYKCTIQDLKNLTREEANAIYKKGYWDPIRADELPSGLDYMVFDFYVNSGSWAVKILQRVLGLKEDGIIGSLTMKAIEDYPGGTRALIKDYADARMKFLQSLGGPQGFGPNGRGWTIRVIGKDPKGQYKDQLGVLGNALLMAKIDDPKNTVTAKNVEVIPTTLAPEIQENTAPKASNENKSVTSISKSPEALAGYAAAGASILTAVSGNTVLSYAIGAVAVIGALAGVYYIVKSKRAQA